MAIRRTGPGGVRLSAVENFATAVVVLATMILAWYLRDRSDETDRTARSAERDDA